MEGLQRCQACQTLPDTEIENTTKGFEVTLFCACGHMAMGDTLEIAVSNWNTYLMLSKVA